MNLFECPLSLKCLLIADIAILSYIPELLNKFIFFIRFKSVFTLIQISDFIYFEYVWAVAVAQSVEALTLHGKR